MACLAYIPGKVRFNDQLYDRTELLGKAGSLLGLNLQVKTNDNLKERIES